MSMKLLLCGLFFLFTLITYAQNPLINELDADTDGVDTKEFIEIKTDNPFQPLDGYLLVLFNGSNSGGDLSYYNFDLDGFTTDINGLFVLGASEVSPIPDFELPLNTIQNGADAVAIYQANESDMPIGSLATTTNLVDALVYGTNDADDTALLNLLGLSAQIDEGANGNKDFESIQRANDGSWFVDLPTPKQLNDGSGVILNGITISTDQDIYDEGEIVTITLTTEDPVSNDITFNLDLNNGDFNNADYTGNAFIDFQTGDTTGQTQINILADGVAEEDEFMEINISNLPPEFISNNNNVSIIIIDGDFTTSNFGSPLNPTFDNVSSNAPNDYYDNLDGLAGNALIQGITNLISENGVVRTHTYTDIIDILKEADQNPNNNNQVWLVYTEQPRAKFLFQTGSSSIGKWNREHTFPRSRGGFSSIEDDDIADGINVWWETNADSLRHANSDAHGLRAADAGENSSRGNQHYGQYVGPPSNAGSFKGDVARGVFFLALRYNDLDVVNGFPSITGELGDLATLLTWHQQDPPDDFEMNRNNVIYDWQNNRNPFIDFPNLVDFIWGTEFGNPWNQNLSLDETSLEDVVLYPNPVENNTIQVKGLNSTQTYQFKLLDITGKIIWNSPRLGNAEIPVNLKTGVYFLTISDEISTHVERIIVK